MNGNDIIKRLIAGEFYHYFHQIRYMVCGDNTLVVLADFRLDCGIIDKIHREHTFKHNIWLSFCDNGTVIDEVQRTNGKVFKVAEYLYHPSSMNEEDVSFIKEAILNINNGALADSHNNPDSNSPTVRLKTTYHLTVEQNGINKKVRGEWGSKEEAVGIGLNLYKNHNQEDYIVFLITVLRFPQHDGTAREMPFPCKIENIIESKSKTKMKTENRNRNVVRLTESKLKQIIAESVRWTLNEWQYGPYGEPSYDDVDLDRSAFHNVGARPSNEPIRKKELSAIEQFNEKIGSSNGILQQLHMFLYDNENIDQYLKQHICESIRFAMQRNMEAQNIITDYCRKNNIKISMESPWEL